MGVTAVLSYPIPENKSCQQVLESLYKLMDILGAKQSGTFKIDCETFNSATNSQNQKILQLFHDTEFPLTTFSLIDNGVQYLIADGGAFDTIVQTYLSQVYPCKKSQKIESSGKRFELSEGDFYVRIGQVMQENSTGKGITIEIDFTPCQVPNNCWDIICQVAQNFLPISQMPPHPDKDLFLPIDTIRQYQQIFNKLRKQT